MEISIKCQSLSSPGSHEEHEAYKSQSHIPPPFAVPLVGAALPPVARWLAGSPLHGWEKSTNQPKNRSRLRFLMRCLLDVITWPHHPCVMATSSWCYLKRDQVTRIMGHVGNRIDVTESWLSGIIDVSRWEKMLFSVIIHLLRFISQTLTLLYRILL